MMKWVNGFGSSLKFVNIPARKRGGVNHRFTGEEILYTTPMSFYCTKQLRIALNPLPAFQPL